MKRDRNQEGYHDPTAGKAIRRASKKQKQPEKWSCLTYTLEEAQGFRQVVEYMKK